MKHDDTALEQALETLSKNTNKKDWATLVKAISIGIVIVCLGVPALGLGAGYYLAESYFKKPSCICPQ